ncbi:MAG: hypothetical protein M3008_10440 [Chloroflexota bacterium]|nr:hypothetical protein [Chloroflexota bacterium]
MVGTLLVTGVIGSFPVSADSCQRITRLGDQPIGCFPVYHTVLAKETDPAIDDPTGGPHLAGAPSCTNPQHDELVLFLAATGFDPTQGRPLLDLAKQHCLHVIGLGYPNAELLFGLCTNAPDPDCFERVRLQKLDGVQRSPLLTTTPANGIENRLLKLLRHLAATFPSEGWDRFIDGGDVHWQAVMASGHSQGGGMVAILGKVHPLARVVMLSAVPDAIGGFSGTSPAWVGKAGATPADRYYGFGHVKDQWWPVLQKNWAALTLTQFGPVVNVDGAAAPYQGSHMLATAIAYDTNEMLAAHKSTLRNAEMFSAVWAYMLLPA